MTGGQNLVPSGAVLCWRCRDVFWGVVELRKHMGHWLQAAVIREPEGWGYITVYTE